MRIGGLLFLGGYKKPPSLKKAKGRGVLLSKRKMILIKKLP